MKDFWRFYRALLVYKEQFGDLKIPYKYCIDGYKLGYAVCNVRSGRYALDDSEVRQLNQIGFLWRAKPDFYVILKSLKDYVRENGDCRVKVNYVTKEGIALGKLVQSLRVGNRRITESQRAKLDEIGFVWNVATKFDTVLYLLNKYKEKHGNCNVPYSFVTDDGIRLGHIMYEIKVSKRKTTEEQKESLRELGFNI